MKRTITLTVSLIIVLTLFGCVSSDTKKVEAYNLQIEVPNDWGEFKDISNTGVKVLGETGSMMSIESPSGAQVILFSPTNSTQLISEVIDIAPSPIEKVTINGNEFYKMTMTGNNGGILSSFLITEVDGIVDTCLLLNVKESEYNKYPEVYDSIVDSLEVK